MPASVSQLELICASRAASVTVVTTPLSSIVIVPATLGVCARNGDADRAAMGGVLNHALRVVRSGRVRVANARLGQHRRRDIALDDRDAADEQSLVDAEEVLQSRIADCAPAAYPLKS